MTSAPPGNALLPLLVAEKTRVEQFVTLLEAEQTALTDGDTGALPELARKKEELAHSIVADAWQRNALLATQGLPADRDGMHAWSMAHPEQKETAETWTQILSLAAKARELNRVNGELIRMRLQYNSQALEILTRKENPLDLYGPDGQSRTQASRRIDDAV